MRSGEHPVGDGRQRGFTYLGLLFIVALVGAGLGLAASSWTLQQHRQIEREQIWRGQAIGEALARYHAGPQGRPSRAAGEPGVAAAAPPVPAAAPGGCSQRLRHRRWQPARRQKATGPGAWKTCSKTVAPRARCATCASSTPIPAPAGPTGSSNATAWAASSPCAAAVTGVHCCMTGWTVPPPACRACATAASAAWPSSPRSPTTMRPRRSPFGSCRAG